MITQPSCGPRLLNFFSTIAVAATLSQLVARGVGATDPVTVNRRGVENGLTARVHIKGQPLPRWTIRERMAHYHVPGLSLAIINHGSMEWAAGYGTCEAGRDVSVDRDTLFQAASVSKVITALATLRLVQLQRVGLKDDVNGKLKNWKLANSTGHPVTVEELLSHSAEINWPAGESALPAADPVPTLLQRLNGEAPALNLPVQLDGIPGSGFRYSNGGYLILGQMISDVMGQPFAKATSDLVFRPLDIVHSTFELLKPDNAPNDIAFGHSQNGTLQAGKWRVVGAPEGGLWTTATDLAKAVVAIQGAYTGNHTSFLSTSLARQMLTKQNERWGLGVQVQGSGNALAFRHDGSSPGYKAVLFAYTSRGQGALILTNGDRGGELADELLYSVAATYDWPDFRVTEKVIRKVDEHVLTQYIGRYEMAPGAYATISMHDGTLFGEVRGRSRTELFPETETKFFMIEGPTVEFEKDSNGRVIDLVFDGSFRAKRAD